MSKKSDAESSKASVSATMSFEQATEELEAIIERIEEGEIGLEDALAERKRGEALITRCRAILDVAEQELREIEAAGDDPGANENPTD